VWLALDAQTREIVGVHIGDHSATSAGALWQSMPPVYRQCAVIYSDFWSAYELVLPSKRHHAATSVSIGQKSIVIFQKVRQSHWCNLEFYSLLQCFFTTDNILSSLALPACIAGESR